ncbi:unnamed protein product [Caretta caretta]
MSKCSTNSGLSQRPFPKLSSKDSRRLRDHRLCSMAMFMPKDLSVLYEYFQLISTHNISAGQEEDREKRDGLVVSAADSDSEELHSRPSSATDALCDLGCVT